MLFWISNYKFMGTTNLISIKSVVVHEKVKKTHLSWNPIIESGIFVLLVGYNAVLKENYTLTFKSR